MAKNIFLSRPSTVDPVYRSTIKRLTEELKKRDLKPITIGSTSFTNGAPLRKIRKDMASCCGIIILGIPQMLVKEGISTKSEKKIDNALFPSVWNQIEGAMAFTLENPLPTMLISEKGLFNEGIFEYGILGITNHEYNLKSADWMRSNEFLQSFKEWFAQCSQFSARSNNTQKHC